MQRIKKKVFDWINELPTIMSQQNIYTMLELKDTYLETEINIADGEMIAEIFQQNFGERTFYPIFGDEQVTNSMLLSRLNIIYSRWKERSLPNLQRAFYALMSEYNPLDNYNGHEIINITYGKTIDTEYGRTESTEYGKTNELATDIYGYNSGADGAPSDKVTSSDGGTDGVTYGGSDGVTEGGTEKHETTKSGNLGVTTSQQMINSEWEMRKHDFVLEAVKAFVDEYTIY